MVVSRPMPLTTKIMSPKSDQQENIKFPTILTQTKPRTSLPWLTVIRKLYRNILAENSHKFTPPL